MNDRPIEDDLLQLQLQNGAHGTAAVLLSTHIIVALAQKGVFSPDDAIALVDAATASALGLGEHDEKPSAYVRLVVETLGRMRGLLLPLSTASH